MSDTPANWLFSDRLRSLHARLSTARDGAEAEPLWAEANAALREAEAQEDADVALPVWERDLDAVRQVIAAWDAGTMPLVEWDKAVLKRAFKAFKKRLKLVRLDDESTAGANPLSQGRESSIRGISPPAQYAQEVWDLLVSQGKLRDAGHGLLELATI